jgi:hypothetical protein
MVTIRTVRPNVTRDEALEQLSAHNLAGLWRRVHLGPLRSLADVYVPFRLFRVQIHNGSRREERFLAVDAVVGTLDPYGFDAPPDEKTLLELEVPNSLPAKLDESRLREVSIEQTRRQSYSQGFFHLRDLLISAQPFEGELYVPYWIGFFGRDERAYLVVLDAVRRRFEGAKARALFEDWLRA